MKRTRWNLMRVSLLCAALSCHLSFAQQWTFTPHLLPIIHKELIR